jgi:quinol monooxygenase YgiN
MITWTVGLTVHPGKRDEWIALSNELTTTSHELDDGCVVYLCVADTDDPNEFLWYEQWDGEVALQTHIERLHGLLGGAAVPPAKLSPRLADLLARREVTVWHERQDAPPAPADRRAPEVTMVTYATSHAADADLEGVIWSLTRTALAESGCVTYVWHRAEADPNLLMLFEQWRDEAAYLAFVERADPPGALAPLVELTSERRLPVVA